MTVTTLQTIVDCSGGSIRNDEIQPPTDPILVLTLEAQDGTVYLLPLSDRGAERLLQAISDSLQLQDSQSEQEPPEPTRLQ
jgi:hypothetical protein